MFEHTSGTFQAANSKDRIYFQTSFSLPRKQIRSEQLHLVLLHGLFENHHHYTAFRNYLMQKIPCSLLITMIDLRGHGQSSGPRGYIKNLDEYALDLIFFLNNFEKIFKKHQIPLHCFSEFPLQTLLMGHGLGANISLQSVSDLKTMISTSISGVILANPLLCFRDNFITALLKKCLSSMAFNLPHPLAYLQISRDFLFAKRTTHFDALAINAVNLSLLTQLFSISRNSTRQLYDLKFTNAFSKLFLLAGKDQYVDNYYAKKILAPKQRLNDNTLFYYPEKQHEFLQLHGKESVYNDLFLWLQKKFILSGQFKSTNQLLKKNLSSVKAGNS
ncbi:MAG: alpha/beta fold hydrolase [Oligoflexia bacterium]|nr:alpha/beta fold hydrolase [Oligoflexia bacterium]MBF0365355.1 alpha/beta fold hydrolase [Oligoflexia bacterium]